ncbi:MAG: glycosyltransferase family 2 protein [Syntrophobacteraceae bacterium]
MSKRVMSARPDTTAGYTERSEPGPQISVVIPLHNEATTLEELYERVRTTMEALDRSWELVLVDDGSTDDTPLILDTLYRRDPRVTIVHLRRNYGQTPALMAGFHHARGELIVSLDGDLQHAPEEIPDFIHKIEEGYDMVSGWRTARTDAYFTRTIPSRIANWLIAKVSGVNVHDFGTTFKAYRREVLADLHLYGDLHRFVPALIALNGAKIVEIPIKDMGRNQGKSHYGLGRTFRVAFDLVTVGFLKRYMTRPLHFFGKLFLGFSGLASAIVLFLLYRKFLVGIDIFHEHGPLALMGSVLMITGIQFLAIGLLSEVLMRIYFESQDKKIYSVRKVCRME